MNLLQASVGGSAAFREPEWLLRGLTPAIALTAVPGLPYTIADLLYHLQATLRASLDLASGRASSWPEDLTVWPQAPLTAAELPGLLAALHLGLAEAVMLAESPSERARDILTDLATHNAYHWGQVALLRRLLNDWSDEDPMLNDPPQVTGPTTAAEGDL